MRRLHGGFLAVSLLLIVCQGQLLAQRTSRSYEGAYRTFYGSGYDSRYGLGTVPMDKVVGQAFVKIWPPGRWGLL